MNTQLPSSAPTIRRSPQVTRRKKNISHGNWKLVYADFVTVLMAFFIVVWIMLFDLVSERDKLDTSCLQPLAAELQKMQNGSEVGKQQKSFMVVDYSIEGLRLTLLDTQKPMFQTGSSVLSNFAREKFSKIASVIEKCPGHKLKIEGYTDATAYAGGTTSYSNWELSTERANAARRELVSQKISTDRITQVIGYGDSVPSMPGDPTNPLNRRISITILPPIKKSSGG